MEADPSRRQNALAKSRSPYLLQHASNPVDWMEWGEAAFAMARERQVPIFLSIGYSTCHWCHVMARESFESEEIAGFLNGHFVNVKLDREERPDVDRVYMAYVQATTGGGGWPMSVWLTPDLKPFYGGTYFPPEDRYGRVGFLTLVQRIAMLWDEQREMLCDYGEKSEQLLSENASIDLAGEIGLIEASRQRCIEELEQGFDEEWGGFGSYPKFPMASNLRLLIRSMEIDDSGRVDGSAARMLRGTLDGMVNGGIWDHVGGGFHRYSVDRYWHVPHFEKMLYDQGQLAQVFADSYRLVGNVSYMETACRIVDYVEEMLLSPEGGFFAAEDADSARDADSSVHCEGAFYVWRQDELEECLGERFRDFARSFELAPEGNARPESDPHQEFQGWNILCRRPDASPLEGERSALELLKRLRARRARPHRDEKIVLSWNAMMISGCCRVAQICGYEKAGILASNAARFIERAMWSSDDGRLRRTYLGEVGDVPGFAEDYAAMLNACIDLYETDFDAGWLEWAQAICRELLERFEDKERGGFFANELDGYVLTRMRDDSDGAEPSASSMAAIGMIRLGSVLDDSSLREKALRVIESFGGQWSDTPRAMPLMLLAGSLMIHADSQLVIVGPKSDERLRSALRAVQRHRRPSDCILYLDSEEPLPMILAGNASVAAMYESRHVDAWRFYLCEGFRCQSPIADKSVLEETLRQR